MDEAETSAQMSITEARQRFTHLPQKMAAEQWTSLAVTRRGKPVLAVLPWELYESILETMEILGDPELMTALRQSLKDIREGRTYTTEELRKELEL